MKIKEAIIVEGVYDKIAVDSACDALVVPTYGFSIFTDTDRLSYIQSLAEKNGIIILMDTDRAGFKIRSFLHERITRGLVRDAYIPSVIGKEKRKSRPSAEGTLGVEGMEKETLLSVLEAVASPRDFTSRPITSMDFYRDGLLGSEKSAAYRAALSKTLSLPPRLSTKALLGAVNALMNYEEYEKWRNGIT